MIDTGARTGGAAPRRLLEQVQWLDHAGMLELGTLPEHLLVLGGGCVAWVRADVTAASAAG